MNEKILFSANVHYGKNIKRLREILGVKQETMALALNVTQQAVSDLEKKANISDDILDRISKVLNVPVEVVKNFDEDAAISIISNTFNDVFHDNSSFINYKPTFTTDGRIVELFEHILRVQQEGNILLEKILNQKVN